MYFLHILIYIYKVLEILTNLNSFLEVHFNTYNKSSLKKSL